MKFKKYSESVFNISLILIIGITAFLATGCSSNHSEVQQPTTTELSTEMGSQEETAQPEASLSLTECRGSAAVVTEETIVSDAYSIYVEDSEKLENYTLYVNQERMIQAGTPVALLSENETTAHISLAEEGGVMTFCDVPTEIISTEKSDLAGATIAQLSADASVYDSRNGQQYEEGSHISGQRVTIQSNDGDWANVQGLFGGDETLYWVHTEDLSFNWYQEVMFYDFTNGLAGAIAVSQE